MEIPVTFNLDNGFLRRECPSCQRQFKWHHGPVDDRPPDAVDPPLYTCPYCGLSANHDAWWTPAQLDYMQEAAAGPALEMIGDELEKSLRNSKHLKFKKARPNIPPAPPAPAEPPDMHLVMSPCHAWEPIKIADDWTEPIFCIVCGDRFVV